MQEREAINEILVNINEVPLDIDDLVSDINIAVIAKKFLDVARLSILSYGWDFNSIDTNMYPNTSGYIVIPKSYISVDADNMVVRDWKLYNKSTSSYKHDASVSCQIVEDIYFDDIPFNIANYIVKTASLATYSNVIGDTNGIQYRSELVKLSKIEAIRDDANKIDGNVLTNTYATTLLDRTSL